MLFHSTKLYNVCKVVPTARHSNATVLLSSGITIDHMPRSGPAR